MPILISSCHRHTAQACTNNHQQAPPPTKVRLEIPRLRTQRRAVLIIGQRAVALLGGARQRVLAAHGLAHLAGLERVHRPQRVRLLPLARVHRGQQVNHEGEDVEREDEGDDPLEDGRDVVVLLRHRHAERDEEPQLHEYEDDLRPERDG